MENTFDRKCDECKQKIAIQCDDVKDVIYYQKLYYHTLCFCKRAERRSKSKRGNPSEWAYAFENIKELESYTRGYILANLSKPKKEDKPRKRKPTDDLNDYLLENYNVQKISDNYFWSSVMDLGNGIYKGRKCKKVSLDVLLEAWKWGQKKLNDIDKRNKMNHKGPSDDYQRLFYDLSIIVRHIPDYLSYKAKQDALSAEVASAAPITHINYDNMVRTETKQEGLDDISALLDEF